MPNLQRSLHSSLPFLSFFFVSLWGGPLMAKELIPVGVVLDLNSPIGSTAQSCISMAFMDFYELNPHYKTRLDLRTKDSKKDVVTAASAVQHLINTEKVHVIIGPQTSEQARFVIELGTKAKVPIISFSATSPSLSPTQYPYFIRTAQDDCSQVEAIAAIIETYGWQEIILVCEDSEYGIGLIPYLNDALVKIGTRVRYRSVIDPNSKEPEILKELHKLKHKVTRIFLVHMTGNLGSRFFIAAKKAGMMTHGYGWIVTEGLSAELDPMGSEVMDSMQGVLGVKPAVLNSSRLEDFKRRWKASSVKSNNYWSTLPTLFGLWAYDTVWALAMAVENVSIANSTSQKQNVSLLSTILATKFSGLFGNFNLIKGQLEPTTLKVFNVRKQTETTIGNWSPQTGVVPDSVHAGNSISKMNKLKQPEWPGNTAEQPPKLRIGTPVGNGANGFQNVKHFSFDVFSEVLKVLPFNLSYEFTPFEKNGETAGNYDQLIMQIKNEKFDAVVGDVTIVANRSNYVDFTFPFLESRVSMVVSVKHDKRRNMWIFLKPLSLPLWLTTGVAFIFTGFIVWFLEHRSNMEFRGPPKNQLGIVFWFSFSTLVFAQKERIENNLSRFVLILWVFVVLILTQSYTASLASILTIQRLQPAFIDINEIKMNNYSVGYKNGSFVKGLLIEHLGFNESILRAWESPEDYHQALSLGSKNGGVAAIFDEIIFLELFLAKYGSKYKMVGPTYKTDGFGFAFPLNSPLVSHLSRAILTVTEDNEKFDNIWKKHFSSEIMAKDQSFSMSSDSPSLTVESFGGLFIVTLVTSLLSFLFYVFKFLHSKRAATRGATLATDGRVDPAANPGIDDGATPATDGRVDPVPNPGTDDRASPAADGRDNQSSTHIEEVDADHNGALIQHTGILSPEHNGTSSDVSNPS